MVARAATVALRKDWSRMPSPRFVICGRVAVVAALASFGVGGVARALPASAAANYSSVILASSPLAYWRLNDQAGSTTAVDDTGNFNGTYASCVQLGRKGPISDDPDTAAFFGQPGCWMTYQPSTSYAGAYSVEAWVKPGSATKRYQTIFDTRGPEGQYSSEYSFDLGFLGSDYNGKQQLHIDVGDGQEWLSNGMIPFPFTAGKWYYIAVTVNPLTHRAVLYVNGTVLGRLRLADHGLPTLFFDPHHPIAVGGNPRYDLISGNPNPGNFDGTIGQVAVYESVLTSGAIATHFQAGAKPGVSIVVKTALPTVTGDTWVVYKGGAKYSTATIKGQVTGAKAGQVAELFASQFPYKTGFKKAAALTLNGTTNTYTFRARPTLATRYKVELRASARASSPLLTSPTRTVYVSSAAYFITRTSCHPPVCHLTAKFRILVPPSTFTREHNKTWLPYFGLLHVNRLPKTLYLRAGNGRAVAGPKLSPDGFNLTLTFRFRIGNGPYGWYFEFCHKDTESADGLGLPGHHQCGAKRISRFATYVG